MPLYRRLLNRSLPSCLISTNVFADIPRHQLLLFLISREVWKQLYSTREHLWINNKTYSCWWRVTQRERRSCDWQGLNVNECPPRDEASTSTKHQSERFLFPCLYVSKYLSAGKVASLLSYSCVSAVSCYFLACSFWAFINVYLINADTALVQKCRCF